jgi:hypothetical protein
LADHVGVEIFVDVRGVRDLFYPMAFRRSLLVDDLVAEVNAFVANVDAWAGDQL